MCAFNGGQFPVLLNKMCLRNKTMRRFGEQNDKFHLPSKWSEMTKLFAVHSVSCVNAFHSPLFFCRRCCCHLLRFFVSTSKHFACRNALLDEHFVNFAIHLINNLSRNLVWICGGGDIDFTSIVVASLVLKSQIQINKQTLSREKKEWTAKPIEIGGMFCIALNRNWEMARQCCVESVRPFQH